LFVDFLISIHTLFALQDNKRKYSDKFLCHRWAQFYFRLATSCIFRECSENWY